MSFVSEVTASGLVPPPVPRDRLSVFLDLDGVLAPLVSTPDGVGPDPERSRVLSALVQRMEHRVAVISGRTLDEIDRITEGHSPAASGIHGLEWRLMNGQLFRTAADPAIQVVVQRLYEFAAEHPGVFVEDKGMSAGLHYRQAPEAEEAAIALAQQLCAQTGLELQPGGLVLELKTPGSNKGMALERFMQHQPFESGMPIMIGDDLTDEYGFEAAVRRGGFGILVGPERPTAAQYRLNNVPEVFAFLDQLGVQA